LLLPLLAVAALPVPALAQSGERIAGYRIDMEITEPEGDLVVNEFIDYDFGANERHGIFRKIPERFPYDDTYERIYPIEVLEVSGSPGTPAEHETSHENDYLVLKIGDPDETITGRHRYEISYRVRGALNGFDDHVELYWNAVGFEWRVAIDDVRVYVTAPADITRVTCFAGPNGSTEPCSSSNFGGRTASFQQPALGSYESMTVVVGMPTGAVEAPEPVLDERWSFGRAFRATPATVGAALALMLLVLAVLFGKVFSRGRDRRFAGSAVDASLGTSGPEEPVAIFERPVIPVEFAPPESLRPGLVGTLVDETAHTLDVVATIVDLAVRGYIRIEEIPKEGWFGKPDWWLHKLRDEEGLLPYERLLFLAIFSAGQQEVMLSQLEDKFASDLKQVQEALYTEVVKQGWFGARPDRMRQKWVAIGIALLVVGIVAVVAAAAFTKLGLVALPLPVAGLLVLAFARWMPSRTAKGTSVVRRIKGFRRFIEESEADRARFAESKNLFSEYLPYAVVFGSTRKWAKAFEGLEGELPETPWFTGGYGHSFNATSFHQSMNGFAVTTAGTIASTPSSSGGGGFSGGGFSGGGGGGGGGGSW
jgi:uncharacterized protein (TIGR04222 family)